MESEITKTKLKKKKTIYTKAIDQRLLFSSLIKLIVLETDSFCILIIFISQYGIFPSCTINCLTQELTSSNNVCFILDVENFLQTINASHILQIIFQKYVYLAFNRILFFVDVVAKRLIVMSNVFFVINMKILLLLCIILVLYKVLFCKVSMNRHVLHRLWCVCLLGIFHSFRDKFEYLGKP